MLSEFAAEPRHRGAHRLPRAHLVIYRVREMERHGRSTAERDVERTQRGHEWFANQTSALVPSVAARGDARQIRIRVDLEYLDPAVDQAIVHPAKFDVRQFEHAIEVFALGIGAHECELLCRSRVISAVPR